MSDLEISFPFGGLSDNEAAVDQPEGTTRDARNVRGIDPVTNRRRGGQRSGLTKATLTIPEEDAQIDAGGAKVDAIAQVVYAQKNVDYDDLDDGDIEIVWQTTTPSKTNSQNVKADRQSNVYALDGMAGIIKYNSEMAEVFRIAVPVAEEQNRIRALFVDEFDVIYVGVSEGGDSTKAKVFAYKLEPENKFSQIWKIINTFDESEEEGIKPGGFVEEIMVKVDLLYLAVNYPDSKTSAIQVWTAIDSVAPQKIKEFPIPFPVNAMDVAAKDGSVFTAHEAQGDDPTNPFRGPNPRAPGYRPRSQDWNPKDLPDAAKRIWSWYDATTLKTFDPDLEENDPVLVWRDISGNQRHFYVDDLHGKNPPTYNERGIADRPSVRGGSGVGMITEGSPAVSKTYADQQRNMMPSYHDSMFCIFMVVRLPIAVVGDSPQVIMFQESRSNVGGGQANDHILYANRAESNSNPGPLTSGRISWEMKTSAADPGDGGAQTSEDADFTLDPGGSTNETATVLVTMLWDGAVNSGDPSTAKTRSIYRINGNPIDRFTGIEHESLLGTRLFSATGETGMAIDGTFDNDNDFVGDIAEILVLRRLNDNDDTEPTMFTDSTTTSPDKMGSDPGTDDAPIGDQGDFEITRIEGYLAHKWGIFHLLPEVGDTYPHHYGQDADGFSGPPLDGPSGNAAQTINRYPMLAKWAASGELRWVYNQNTGTETTTNRGGVGYGVKVNSLGEVYSIGPDADSVIPSGDIAVRKLIDKGETVSDVPLDGAWRHAIAGSREFDNRFARLAVDKFDNLYVPYFEHNNDSSLLVFDKDGIAGAGVVLVDYKLPDGQLAYAVAVDPQIPEYEGDLTDPIAEYVYLGTENQGDTAPPDDGHETVHRIRLVSRTIGTDPPRQSQTVAVAGGSMKLWDASSVTAITGGTGIFTAGNQPIFLAPFMQKIYSTDGLGYFVYDPKTGEVTQWKATSSGTIPAGAKLLEVWNQRLVVARTPDAPQGWFMSKRGNPLDWDFFPPVPAEGDAVAWISLDTPGIMPDIVNAIVPEADQLILFGGDHSIYRFNGDPTAGGQIDLVSDQTGMAFGRPWCKDPEGKIWFIGSRGGLFVMTPGGRPERVTENTIEKRLREIDFGTFRVELAWNPKDDGVHVLQLPFGPGGAQIVHWFWEARTGAIWEDVFGSEEDTSVQPTAVCVLDGDESDDRILVIGCEDSFIRKWDPLARDDDSLAIDAYFTLGPLGGRGDRDQKYKGLKLTLAEDQDGATWEFLSSDEADFPGAPLIAGEVHAGQNPRNFQGVRGAAVYLRIRNSLAGQRFAFERGSLRVYSAGRLRART